MWHDVPGLDLYLQVTKAGKVRRKSCLRRWIRKSGAIHDMPVPARVLRIWVDRQGYATVAVRAGTKQRKKFLVHRLVGLTFLPKVAADMTINHINGDKLDNRLANLEWLTRSENAKDQWRRGGGNHLRGENHPLAKLSNKDAADIREIFTNADHPSDGVIGRKYGVSAGLIRLIRKGKVRKP